MIKRIHGYLLLFLLSMGVAANAATFPAPARVVDEPGLLSFDTTIKLTLASQEHEKATGNQVVVVIVNNMGGLDVKDYANQLARAWGVGQKGKNNGVVFLIAYQERKVRIEVGYGLESQLPDAKARRILSNITPYLKRGDWNTGVTEAVNEIITAIRH